MNASSKKWLKVTGLLMIVWSSQNVMAASTITVPEEIVVVSINDQAIKSSFLKNTKEYKVNPGPTLLNVRYQDYFEYGLTQHDIVKSNLVQIQVPQLEDNQRYVLKLVNPPKNHDEAKVFSQQPNIELINQNNQKVPQHLSTAVQSKSSLFGGLFGQSQDLTQSASVVQFKQSENRSQQNVTNELSRSNPKAVENTKATDSIKNNGYTNDQKLIDLWQGASKLERQKFMSWLAEQ